MNAVIENFDVFIAAFGKTVLLTIISGVISIVFGLILASFSISPSKFLRVVNAVYVGLMRNIPAAAHLFFTIFVLPLLGVKLSFFALACIGITVYFSAYFSDAFRSGINSIGRGQLEAAQALGLKKSKILRQIVFPQGIRNSVPPLINTMIALIKVTAIAGVFGVTELFGGMLQLINTNDSAVIALMVFTALLYSILTIPAGYIAGIVERKVVFTT
ncbi:amino acid ABC transporter permease [Arthrobacter sp. MYb213]|uniref:amino acid ABC transporter permease n=1 Tax=Arthrobacter sp. MYb213 TaxID=1848595 RepID=UPI000CFADD57|nr:amino acid ABC transporter permease [Arthrobacter sp. MYb213]PRB66817.1 amino acid ABC transporter permease [Arthrobacter sp. MYb213]